MTDIFSDTAHVWSLKSSCFMWFKLLSNSVYWQIHQGKACNIKTVGGAISATIELCHFIL